MSILIKGKNMPLCCFRCWECDKYTNGSWFCVVENRSVEEDFKETRPQWCPLVELPPHGRLIDGDVAEVIVTDEKDEVGGFLDGILYAADWIADQPTIIEAEVSE